MCDFGAVYLNPCISLCIPAGMAYKGSSTAPDIEQTTVTTNVNFTGTLNMMRTFTPMVKPHGRIVNVTSMAGHLSRLASSDLRDKFSSPSLTETELVGLMEEFVSDVKQGKHRGKWCNTFYSTTKIGEVALTKVYAKELAKTGKNNPF